MSELADEVYIDLSVSLSLLLFLLSESIVRVHVAIALHASENSPEWEREIKRGMFVETHGEEL